MHKKYSAVKRTTQDQKVSLKE